MYRRAIGWRNRRFDAGRGVVEFDRPVLSIGNLSTGGTGKTPLVKWLVSALRERGHRPCIAMRGYKPRNGQSDEAMEYAEEWPDVPLVVQPDRTAGLIDLFAGEHGSAVDCIVLDDGFQHRQIARQCDLVVVDATRSPFEDQLLPAGHLREEPASLARAGGAIVTRTDLAAPVAVEALERKLAAIGKFPIARTSHAWKQIRAHAGGKSLEVSAEELRGQVVHALCAIGNPHAFFQQIAQAGLRLGDAVALQDHDYIEGAEFDRLCELSRRDAGVLVTQKDWMKLRDRAGSIPGRVLCVHAGVRFERGESSILGLVFSAFDRFATADE